MYTAQLFNSYLFSHEPLSEELSSNYSLYQS